MVGPPEQEDWPLMSIADMFRKSPFEPLQQHLNKVKECVAFVVPMFQCVRDEDYERLGELAKHVFKAEHEADVIKNEIRQTIPTTFFLPVYRGDLLAYLKLQDDMADTAEDLAVRLQIRQMHLPEPLRDDVLDLAVKVVAVCEKLYEAADCLNRMAQQGSFAGQDLERLLRVVADAEHTEWECDKAGFALAKKLFALEDQMRATDIFLWSRVLTELGKLANCAEKTGERVRRMLAK